MLQQYTQKTRFLLVLSGTIRYNHSVMIVDEQTKEMVREAGSLTVVVMLIFVMSTFTSGKSFAIPLNLLHFSLTINFRLIDLITPVTAVVSALGVYSMVSRRSDDPFYEKFVHMIIPFATTLALGIILRNVTIGVGWIAVLYLGGILLVLVFSAECILWDRADIKIPFSVLLISASAYAVFLIAIIGIRINISRLVLELPPVFFLAFILALRILMLEPAVKQEGVKALTIALLTTEFDAAMHYIPLNPLSFGVIILTFFYLLTNVMISLPQNNSIRLSIISQKFPLGFLMVLVVLIEVIT